MLILPLCLTVTSCDLYSDMHPASHIFTMETSELCVILGIMWPSRASSGNSGKYSRPGFLYCVVCPYGNTTLMVGPMFVDREFGASICK